MATEPNQPDSTHENDFALPQALRDEVRMLFGVAPDVPKAIDQAVLEDARTRMAHRPRVLFTFRRLSAALATAAVLTLVVYIAFPPHPQRGGPLAGQEVASNRSRNAPEAPAVERESGTRMAGTLPATPGAPRSDDRKAAAPPTPATGSPADRKIAAGPAPAKPDVSGARSGRIEGFKKEAPRDPIVAFKQGQATIIDALILAQLIRDSQPVAKALDVNGDGVVDQRDVDAVARQSVNLAAHPLPVGRVGGGPG